jgi:hypothetical protein
VPVLLLSILFTLLLQDGAFDNTLADWLDYPAIEYHKAQTTDPVALLKQNVDAGRVVLKKEGGSGYLRSFLEALNIPLSSQIVVFAQDSVQARRISPSNPRALFFNDSVVVGWVGGGFIEIASQDPKQGVIFYTLDQSVAGKASITRRDECLQCHHTHSAVGIPGMLVRSSGQFSVDQRLPLDQRWGGWYVTGQHGRIQHLGNQPIEKLFQAPVNSTTQNWKTLDGKIARPADYLSAHSDIVALMVFEHQMRMMNLLTRIGWEARVAETVESSISMQDAAKEVVDYLLFVDEAPMNDSIKGSTSFAAEFSAEGPRDRFGRSLRDLDLQQRLMRYPCSYLIYSKQFDALPDVARQAIYQRMWEVLSGKVKDSRYARLSIIDRLSIVEILKETKPSLPEYFQVQSVR